MLTPQQLKERASNKVDSKLFFAVKDLQQNSLQLDGVIVSKMDNDSLLETRIALQREIDVLTYIKDAVDSYNPKSYNEPIVDESQIDLEDLITQMIENNG